LIDRPGAKSAIDSLRQRAEAALRRAGDGRDAICAYVVARDPVWLAVRRPGRPEFIAAAITFALVAAFLLFLVLFDWNWVRGPIGRAASASTGRRWL